MSSILGNQFSVFCPWIDTLPFSVNNYVRITVSYHYSKWGYSLKLERILLKSYRRNRTLENKPFQLPPAFHLLTY